MQEEPQDSAEAVLTFDTNWKPGAPFLHLPFQPDVAEFEFPWAQNRESTVLLRTAFLGPRGEEGTYFGGSV